MDSTNSTSSGSCHLANRVAQCSGETSRRVTVNQRSPRHDVVDIRPPVDIPEPSATCPFDEWRLATDGAEGADRTVDSTGEDALRLRKEPSRCGA